jgi:hypothetical protein
MDATIPVSFAALPMHRAKVTAAARTASDNPEVVAVAVAGSFAQGISDHLSDVDLRLYVAEEAIDRTVAWIPELAASCGRVIALFTGEHVGIPHLTIVLYDDLVHVDFDVLPTTGVDEHNQGLPVVVLWERDGVSADLPGVYDPDIGAELRWIETRFWTWCWYVQTKIMRGELYEALDGVQYLRHVLFGLVAFERGARPAGARRIDHVLGARTEAFAATVPSRADAASAFDSLRAEIEIYRDLTDRLLERHGVTAEADARAAVLAAVEVGLRWSPGVPN